MAPQPVKLRADFELTCFTAEGIDAIKHALLTAKSTVNDDKIEVSVSLIFVIHMLLQFKLIAPPHYRCETVTLDKAKGISKLEEALKVIEKAIKEKSGTFKLTNKPQVIGAKDEKDIEDIKAQIENNVESGGEDNEEGMGDIDLGEEDHKNEDEDEEEDDG